MTMVQLVPSPSREDKEATPATILSVHDWRIAHDDAPATVSTRVRRLVWMCAAAARLSWVRVRLSPDASATAIATLLRNRSVRLVPTRWRARFAYCVLELPGTYADYIDGPQRRRVRKRLSRAAGTSLTIRPLTERERSEVGRTLLTDNTPKRLSTREPAQIWLGAFRSAAEPLAVVIALVDGTAAFLHTSQGNLHGRDIDVRYVLHSALVERLIDLGVTLVLTDSQNCFRTPVSLLRYQYQLGYEIRNVLWWR